MRSAWPARRQQMQQPNFLSDCIPLGARTCCRCCFGHPCELTAHRRLYGSCIIHTVQRGVAICQCWYLVDGLLTTGCMWAFSCMHACQACSDMCFESLDMALIGLCAGSLLLRCGFVVVGCVKDLVMLAPHCFLQLSSASTFCWIAIVLLPRVCRVHPALSM